MPVLGDRSSLAQTQCNHRPTHRAPDNNAEAIIILDGHPKGPDTSASRQRQDAAAPFNTALSDLHPGDSTTSSLRRNLTSSAASRLTHATQHTQQVAYDMAWICQGTWPTSNDAPARMHARTQTSGDASIRRNASRHTPTPKPHVTHRNPLRRRPDARRHPAASTASGNYLTVIVRSGRLPLFRDRISNCTNLFWLEPNRTRHRIFTFVSLLFGKL